MEGFQIIFASCLATLTLQVFSNDHASKWWHEVKSPIVSSENVELARLGNVNEKTFPQIDNTCYPGALSRIVLWNEIIDKWTILIIESIKNSTQSTVESCYIFQGEANTRLAKTLLIFLYLEHTDITHYMQNRSEHYNALARSKSVTFAYAE